MFMEEEEEEPALHSRGEVGQEIQDYDVVLVSSRLYKAGISTVEIFGEDDLGLNTHSVLVSGARLGFRR